MWIAIILGVLEGLTEFIPVSSTGHLILAGHLLQFEGEKAKTFEIFIQLAAILAVVFLYRDRFVSLLQISQADTDQMGLAGLPGIAKLLLTLLPAGIAGILFHEFIKRYLFAPVPVAVALIVGGIVLIAISRRSALPTTNNLDEISYRQCFMIGLFQCLSLWPGVSRSAATIVGGLLLGLEKRVAAEFSFLVAVPTMTAAVLYDLSKNMDVIQSTGDLQFFAVGFCVSFFSALLAIKFFLALLSRYSLGVFGYYRIVLGILVLMFLSSELQ